MSFIASVKFGYEEIIDSASISNALSQLPMLLLMTAIPSVAEDILTRGYLYGHLKFMKPLGWILLSSVVYVFNHIWRLNDGPAVLTYLFLLGLVLGFTVWITKSLWLAFGIHWGANLAFESSHSIMQTKGLVEHDGPTWLLALSWAILLVLLILFYRKKLTQHYINTL